MKPAAPVRRMVRLVWALGVAGVVVAALGVISCDRWRVAR